MGSLGGQLRFTLAGSLAATALLLSAASASAASADRDTTFSGDGISVTTPAGFGDERGGGEDIAVDTQGRILVTFSYDPPNAPNGYAGVERLLPDGSVDTSFGDNGVATYNGITRATRVAVDAQDRVLFAGTRPFGSSSTANVVRLTASGQLDNSFDSNGSRGLGEVEPTALRVRADGRSVLALVPYSSGKPAKILQLTPSGAPDGSFGNSGEARIDFAFPSSGWSRIDDLVVRPDGKVVALGWVASTDFHDLVVRLQSNGSPDPTLNGGRSDQSGFALLPSADWRAVAVDAGGRTVVTGYSPTATDEALARLTTDGRPDQSFGSGGLVALDTTSAGGERPSDVLVDPAGRILMAGSTRTNDTPDCFFIARFTDAGALDTSFSGDGASLDCASILGPGSRVAMDAGGHPLMSGQGPLAGGNRNTTIVIRYLPNGFVPGGDGGGSGGGGGSGSGGSGGVGGAVATNIRNVHVHRLLIPRSLRRLARFGVWALASCDADCRIVVEVEVSRQTATALGLTGTVLARGSRPAVGGERRWVRARFNLAVRRALRRFDGEARLRVNVTGVAP